MIAATGRPSQGPVPGWGADQAGSPEFPVTFSRPAGRAGALANSFRWSGTGTIKITDRALNGMSDANEDQREAWRLTNWPPR
jgi:hypothetical protein